MFCMISNMIQYNLYDTHYISYDLLLFTIYYYDMKLFIYDTVRYMSYDTKNYELKKLHYSYDNIISDEGGILYLPKK